MKKFSEEHIESFKKLRFKANPIGEIGFAECHEMFTDTALSSVGDVILSNQFVDVEPRVLATFNANDSLHREVVKLFIDGLDDPELVGVDDGNCVFILNEVINKMGFTEPQYASKVSFYIDGVMDFRLAIGTDIEFYDSKVGTFTIGDGNYGNMIRGDFVVTLSLDYLDKIGVKTYEKYN
jgi:hypothetical protein